MFICRVVLGAHTISPALTSTGSFVALFGIVSLSGRGLSIPLPRRGLCLAILLPFLLSYFASQKWPDQTHLHGLRYHASSSYYSYLLLKPRLHYKSTGRINSPKDEQAQRRLTGFRIYPDIVQSLLGPTVLTNLFVM